MALAFLRPDADDVDGNWKDSSGGAALFDKIDDVWAYSGAAIDLGFADSIYFDGSSYVSDPTSFLSCSRASTGYAKTRAGALTSFANDTLRITDLGLLVEDARTNIVTRSQELDHADWTKTHTSVTANAVSAPDGTSTADLVIPDATLNFHFIQVTTTITVAATPSAITVYAKAGGYSWITLSRNGTSAVANFNLSTGVVGSVSGTATSAMEALANGWYRCIMYFSATTGIPDNIYISINTIDVTGGGNSNNHTGDGTSGIYLWGAQYEQNSFESSYIPTTSAAATRAADAVTVIGALNTVISGNAQSIVADVKMDTYNDQSLVGTPAQNPVLISAGNAIVDSPGPSLGSPTIGNSKTFTGGAKVGLAWSTSARSVVGGGGTVSSDATNIVGARTNNCRLSGTATGYNTGFCIWRRLTAWSSKLADATLQENTSPFDSAYDTDYDISSPMSVADTDTMRVRLSDPSGTPQAPGRVRFNARKYGGYDMTLLAALMDGSTEIARWEEELDNNEAYQNFTETLTSAQFNAITNFNNLYLNLTSAYQWWLNDSYIDLDFDNSRYYEQGKVVSALDPVLLLHFDGADASTTFIDATGRHPVTAFLGAQIDTAQSVFGGASALFDGSDDYALVESGVNANDFAFGTGDFTVDFRIRPNSFAADGILIDTGNNISAATFEIYITGGKLRMWSNGADRITGATSLSTGTNYHVALARSGGVTKMFLNGTQEGSNYSDSTNYAAVARYPCIGAEYNNGSPVSFKYNGWIDELRIIKGTAAWTANFTPPTVAYNAGLSGPHSHLSCSRASTGYAKKADGTLQSFASDVLRITDLGLLVEDAATNIIPYSADFSGGTSWSLGAATITSNSTTAPDGTTTATKMTEDNSLGIYHGIYRSIANAGAGSYTLSCFFKDGTRRYACLIIAQDVGPPDKQYSAVLDLQTGIITANGSDNSPTGTSSKVEAFGNGWYRLSVTMDMTSSGSIYPEIMMSNSATPSFGTGNIPGSCAAIYNGDNTSFLYIWGAQLEVRPFATSYIPTNGASATRAADVVSFIGTAKTLIEANTLDHSIVVDVANNNPVLVSNDNQNVVGDDTSANDSKLMFGTSGAAKNVGWIYHTVTSDTVAIGSGDFYSPFKLGFSQGPEGISIVGNAGTVNTKTNKMPLTNPRLGSKTDSAGTYAYMRRLSVWNRKLADATLQSLTTS